MEDERTLGQMVGIVSDTLSITNDAGEKVQISIKYDCSTASDTQVKSWIAGNRRIAFQTPTRALGKDEIEKLSGTTVMAVDAGKKVKSLTERKAEALATMEALKVHFPEEYEKIRSSM